MAAEAAAKLAEVAARAAEVPAKAVEVAAKMAEVMAKVAKVAAKSAEPAGKKRITVADGAGAAAWKFRVFPRGRGKRRLKADALTAPPFSAGFTMTGPAGWPWCLEGSRCGLSKLI